METSYKTSDHHTMEVVLLKIIVCRVLKIFPLILVSLSFYVTKDKNFKFLVFKFKISEQKNFNRIGRELKSIFHRDIPLIVQNT